MTDEGRVRVLHVDDDPEFAEVASLHLERVDDDIAVATATSAEDGLDRLRGESFDCVVSDHDMPGMDGLEFLQAVRSEFGTLPFVLFTGKGSEEIASDAISAGVTEYLQKDVGADQFPVLANRIRRAVGERRAKCALEESERRLSTLIANLPGMVYRARNERGWPMEYVSEGAEDLVGYGADDLESGEVAWGDLIVDTDTDRLWDRVQTCIAAGEPFEVSYQVETADGETRWLWERGRVVDADRDVEVLEGFVTDITARKERERELERERQFTEGLMDAIDDAFYVVDTSGAFVRWNDTVAEVTGYTDEEIASMSAHDLIPEAHHDRLDEAVAETVETGRGAVELPIETKDGERVRYEFRGGPVEDADGDLLGIAGIARDITDRTARERKLERYETIVEAVGDPVYSLDADGVFTYVNEAIEPMTGYAPADLVGEHIGTIMTDDGVEEGERLIRDLLGDSATDSGTIEMDVVTRDGRQIPSENNIALLPTTDGEFDGTAGVIRDIAERKERERRLSEFASVVSHDLRNPLNVVQGRVALARETGDVDHLDDAAAAVERMERLIDDLLTLASEGETVGTLDEVNLATIAEQAWAGVDTGAATLAVEGTDTVEADPTRLRELFENLFRNSVDHGPADVTVTVGTDGAGFSVADDGPGIPEDDRDRVFDRGFTTSRTGTGFGLAIVEDIADAHGWTVAVEESESGGARFAFTTTQDGR